MGSLFGCCSCLALPFSLSPSVFYIHVRNFHSFDFPTSLLFPLIHSFSFPSTFDLFPPSHSGSYYFSDSWLLRLPPSPGVSSYMSPRTLTLIVAPVPILSHALLPHHLTSSHITSFLLLGFSATPSIPCRSIPRCSFPFAYLGLPT